MVLTPGILDYLSTLHDSLPEQETLLLPSDLPSDLREKFGLSDLASAEMCLREGEAYDALQSLRSRIRYCNALVQHKNAKKNAIHGQYLNTRAGNLIRNANRKSQDYAQKYRHARSAMIRLGLPSNSTQFPELTTDSMFMKDYSRPHVPGDGSKIEGWIWCVGLPADMSDGERDEYAEDGIVTFILFPTEN
jgi:hypothetical protein